MTVKNCSMYDYQIERLRDIALEGTNYGSLPQQPQPTPAETSQALAEAVAEFIQTLAPADDYDASKAAVLQFAAQTLEAADLRHHAAAVLSWASDPWNTKLLGGRE